jgi:NAD(P)H-quinone oxidoreductase subunit 4
VPIIGIGLYPRLVTDTYRASIEQMVARDESSMKLATGPGLLLRSAPKLT